MTELGDELTTFVVETLETLVANHLPDWRIPGTFAGHRVDPDVAADLVFTLGHLADAGVTEVAGTPIDDAVARVLHDIDGANTHTFFSYRVAETLARYGSFADNRLLDGWSRSDRQNLIDACDSTTWIPLLDQGLPRNYSAVLSRCEVGRVRLGLTDEALVLPSLIERTRSLLASNPRRYLDDSTHGIGRYDIYTADVWLFTEPLADRLGPVWAEGLARALALVETVGSSDGTAVGWGRSTGVLSAALTIELAALAVVGGHTERPGLWMRRAVDATAGMARWFSDGIITAHQHRSTYDYRGPFRRLQMTLDILGKLAWAGAELRTRADELAAAADAYPWHHELVRFEDARPASVWAHRSPGTELVVPFVGATRSDYLAAPHRVGLWEVPVDSDLACWAPTVVANHNRWTAGGIPDGVELTDDGVRATWNQFLRVGHLDPEAAPERKELPGSCTTTWRVDGRSLRYDLDLTFAKAPDAVSVVIPEADGRPLAVEIVGPSDGAHLDTIDVDGLKEWRSFWGTIPTVHQVDLDPAPTHRLSVRVTPKIRVASTAFGHHYCNSLYEPMTAQVIRSAPLFGPLASRPSRPWRRGQALDRVDLFHMHWPEWFAFDDLAEHQKAIDRLTDRRVPIVWTAHNLTPHLKPEGYDPIYQAWADASDGVIHHSAWGEEQMRARYRFPERTRHVVIPHGHFGERYGSVDGISRAELERQFGLAPTAIRIGLLGAPRVEKQVQAFLDGVAASTRDDIQVVCWSLDDERVPDDPRIAIAEPYENVDVDLYGRRLAVCDVIALPFDPAGEMLATGVAADVVGLGLAALVSEWPYLTQTLGAAGIPCGHTAASVAAALDALTPEQVEVAQAASRARQAELAWPVLAEQTRALFDEVILAAAADRR